MEPTDQPARGRIDDTGEIDVRWIYRLYITRGEYGQPWIFLVEFEFQAPTRK